MLAEREIFDSNFQELLDLLKLILLPSHEPIDSRTCQHINYHLFVQVFYKTLPFLYTAEHCVRTGKYKECFQ